MAQRFFEMPDGTLVNYASVGSFKPIFAHGDGKTFGMFMVSLDGTHEQQIIGSRDYLDGIRAGALRDD